MADNWFQTPSGGKFYYFEEEESSQIEIIDIARTLSRLKRFLGSPISVAEHSVAVSEIVRAEGGSERQQLLGLLHDAHEYVLGDWPSPLKKAILERYQIDLGSLSRDIQARIHKALGVSPPQPAELALIERADVFAMATERKLFMPSSHKWVVDRITPPPYVEGLYGVWDEDAAMRYFENTYTRLTGSVAFEQRIAASVDANG